MFALRDYQSDAIGRLTQALADGHRPVLVSPTGSGKTVMAVAMMTAVANAGRRALFLAPRRELVTQTVQKLVAAGLPAGVIMAGEDPRSYAPIQVASVQTLHRRLKGNRILVPQADLVVVDECHLSITKSTMGILERYPEAHIVGLTATPSRADGRALGMVYDSIVPVASVADLTAQGHLCPAIYYAPSEPDLSEIRTDYKSRDFVQSDLERVMDQPQLVGDIVQHWFKLANGRRTVVFATSIVHSEHLAAEFRKQGVAAEHVDAMTPMGERDAIFRRFRSGETTILTNCFLASYGFDLPDLSCVVLARPTKSLVLYLQMVGRGLRPAPGKSEAIVIDHAGAVRLHGMADEDFPWSLDGETTLDERIAAKRKREPEKKSRTCGECRHVFRSAIQCPKCGWQVPRPKRDVDVLDGDLERLNGDSRHDRRKVYAELRGYAASRGWKPGWAFFAYCELFRGIKPPFGWRADPVLPVSTETAGLITHLNIRRRHANAARDQRAA